MPDLADTRHLLRRCEYIARPERVSELRPLSRTEAVDNVLAGLDRGSLTIPPGLTTHRQPGNWKQYVEALWWWMDRMVSGPSPFTEKLTFFWHGHFTSDWGTVFHTPSMVNQHATLYANAAGNVHTLAQQISVDPAMLAYLDNARSRRRSPNQNFARELLELFTIGNGNFTEGDVEAATAAWTGHNLDSRDERRYVFRPEHHDSSTKTFMGVTRNFDGPDIIDQLFRDNPTARRLCARFLSRKLWEYFAYPSPDAEIVDALAEVAIANRFEVVPWMRALLDRDEFWSTHARTNLLRTPVDYTVAVMAHLRIDCATARPEWWMHDMGQIPFRPPNVSGWPNNESFINTSASSARANLARYVTWQVTKGNAYDELSTLPSSAAVTACAELFALSLTPATRTALEQWAEANRNRWWRRPNLLTAIMCTPEMQLA